MGSILKAEHSAACERKVLGVGGGLHQQGSLRSFLCSVLSIMGRGVGQRAAGLTSLGINSTNFPP